MLFLRLEIDDPLQVSQIHGFCGLWGLMAVGIFDKDRGLIVTGEFRQLGIQTIGAISLIIWNLAISGTFFKLLSILNRFRIGQVFELYGMDILENAGISKDREVSDSLKLNVHKLTKLEIRQRRRAKELALQQERDQI